MTLNTNPKPTVRWMRTAFNMQGQLVRRVYQGEVSAGNVYDIELLRGQLPAGMYVLRMQGPELSEVLHQQIVIY